MTVDPEKTRYVVFKLRKAPDALQQDLRFAIRSLRKRPGFAAAVVAVLAVGIGANVAMFSAFHHALIRPLPFPEPENLVLGRAAFNGHLNPDMSAYDFFDYRQRNEVFESVGTIVTTPANVTITGGDEPEQVTSVLVSWDLFPTLGIPAAMGRHFSPTEEEPEGPNVTILSGGYWRRRFGGSPDVIGSTILVDGAAQTIVGVMPLDFRFLHDADLWVPMGRDGPKATSRGWHNWFMVGRLRPGVSLERAKAGVDVISAQLASEYPDTNRTKSLQLTELHAAVAEDYRTAVILLMTAVSLVLLIVCGNVASLLLARGATRRAELCVRSALGASSSRLVRQLLTESMVTSSAGGLCGTTLAIGFQKFILHFFPVDVPRMQNLEVSWSMLVFALGISTISGLIFGIMPALQATGVNAADNIKSGTRTTDSRGQGFHASLVVAQMALSVILLFGSGLLLRSFATLSSVNPGFDTQNLLTMEIRLASDKYPEEAMRIDFFSRLSEELRAIPGVTDVAVINRLPIKDPGYNPAVWAADRPPPDHKDRVGANRRSVLPGYFDAMGIPLLRGRGIEASDTAQAPKVLVINETMARRLFPNEDPLGRPVKIWQEDDNYEVVGIVGDVRVGGLQHAPRLTMYGPYSQQPTLTMRLAIRTAYDATSLAEAVRNVVWSHDRDVPVAALTSMDEIIASTVSNEKVVALSVTLFASVAVLLAAFGLYGVLAYYVSLRTHQIGICMALGAEAGDIIGPILRRGFSLVATGMALGLVGAFWATRFFQQMLFDVAPTDAKTFVVVSVLFASVSLAACLIPARKALRVDPVTALAEQ